MTNILEERTTVGVEKMTFAIAECTNTEKQKIKKHDRDNLQDYKICFTFKEWSAFIKNNYLHSSY